MIIRNHSSNSPFVVWVIFVHNYASIRWTMHNTCCVFVIVRTIFVSYIYAFCCCLYKLTSKHFVLFCKTSIEAYKVYTVKSHIETCYFCFPYLTYKYLSAALYVCPNLHNISNFPHILFQLWYCFVVVWDSELCCRSFSKHVSYSNIKKSVYHSQTIFVLV